MRLGLSTCFLCIPEMVGPDSQSLHFKKETTAKIMNSFLSFKIKWLLECIKLRWHTATKYFPHLPPPSYLFHELWKSEQCNFRLLTWKETGYIKMALWRLISKLHVTNLKFLLFNGSKGEKQQVLWKKIPEI